MVGRHSGHKAAYKIAAIAIIFLFICNTTFPVTPFQTTRRYAAIEKQQNLSVEINPDSMENRARRKAKAVFSAVMSRGLPVLVSLREWLGIENVKFPMFARAAAVAVPEGDIGMRFFAEEAAGAVRSEEGPATASGVIDGKTRFEITRASAGAARDLVFVTSDMFFDKAFIEQQRRESEERLTVAFDMDETIAVVRNWPLVNNRIEYILQPGIMGLLKRLKDKNVKLCLWTKANRPAVRELFRQYPEFEKFFELVVTIESCETAPSGRVDAEGLNTIVKYHLGGKGAKRISHFGWHVLVDDDEDMAEDAGNNKYIYICVRAWPYSKGAEKEIVNDDESFSMPHINTEALYKEIMEWNSFLNVKRRIFGLTSANSDKGTAGTAGAVDTENDNMERLKKALRNFSEILEGLSDRGLGFLENHILKKKEGVREYAHLSMLMSLLVDVWAKQQERMPPGASRLDKNKNAVLLDNIFAIPRITMLAANSNDASLLERYIEGATLDDLAILSELQGEIAVREPEGLESGLQERLGQTKIRLIRSIDDKVDRLIAGAGSAGAVNHLDLRALEGKRGEEASNDPESLGGLPQRYAGVLRDMVEEYCYKVEERIREEEKRLSESVWRPGAGDVGYDPKDIAREVAQKGYDFAGMYRAYGRALRKLNDAGFFPQDHPEGSLPPGAVDKDAFFKQRKDLTRTQTFIYRYRTLAHGLKLVLRDLGKEGMAFAYTARIFDPVKEFFNGYFYDRLGDPLYKPENIKFIGEDGRIMLEAAVSGESTGTPVYLKTDAPFAPLLRAMEGLDRDGVGSNRTVPKSTRDSVISADTETAGAVQNDMLSAQAQEIIAQQAEARDRHKELTPIATQVCYLILSNTVLEADWATVIRKLSWEVSLSPEKALIFDPDKELEKARRARPGATRVGIIQEKIDELRQKGFKVYVALDDRDDVENIKNEDVKAVAFAENQEFLDVLLVLRAYERKDYGKILDLYAQRTGQRPAKDPSVTDEEFIINLMWGLPPATPHPISERQRLREILLQFAQAA